ncbi:hypothetical protein E2C01_063330 [Portunus trituberculatus]|uniref:Uncharacterized protein n=1 Tax=Portunus trituberculatus TaxID=210409 RepID=A0A5B7HHV2_PORTR|nr:hypothetical protein [Portunus trituberculatus]
MLKIDNSRRSFCQERERGDPVGSDENKNSYMIKLRVSGCRLGGLALIGLRVTKGTESIYCAIVCLLLYLPEQLSRIATMKGRALCAGCDAGLVDCKELTPHEGKNLKQ